ncbi:MAG: PLP-dependent aspartate aminotransferase family protein [Acidobacteria bacterium]|nr:PLP-dependent aspartate aminotransferase family protein [Acidobacteriota bacterium]
MTAQPYTGSHASMTDAEKDHIGLSHSLVRLCFGLEETTDPRRDPRDVLASLEQPVPSKVMV